MAKNRVKGARPEGPQASPSRYVCPCQARLEQRTGVHCLRLACRLSSYESFAIRERAQVKIISVQANRMPEVLHERAHPGEQERPYEE